MTFAWPHLLWLAVLPVAWLAWDLLRRRRSDDTAHPKILRAEAGSHSLRLSTLNPQLSTRSQGRARPWLLLGLLLAIVALARPQWGRLEEPVFDQSREILIAIDLSRSMLAPDVKPSRLERAKLLTQALLEKLTGERVGLIVFSGTAFLQSPLSADYEILREFLPALNPEFLPEGGTNYSALIDTALGAFGSSSAADRFLIVLSDGEATDDDWRSRLDELKKKGIRVLGLGVGTAAGAMIPDGTGGLVKDDRGAVVLSKLESKTLHELATATDGVYQDASSWIDLAALITATVDAGKKGDFLEKNTIRLVERFQWPLALALWCLLVSFYYEFPVRPKPRDLKLTAPASDKNAPPLPRPATPLASAAPLLLLIFFLSPLASRLLPAAAAAVSATPPVADTGPQLGKIYSRLATQDRLSNQDLAEVARETLRWGRRLQENGQPVLPGPVHDAIQAVDQLIAEHSTLADWTKLRADLEGLLKKNEDQKQQQQKQDKQDQKDQQQPQDQKDQQSSDQQKQDSSKQDPSKQDQQNQKQSKQDQSSDQKKDQEQQQQQQNGSKSDDQKDQDEKQNQSAFGDMKDHRPPPSQETQKVGGVPDKKEGEPPPQDPQLALPLQKLDQLRNQDSPAELFQLLEGDKKKGAPKSPGKNW